LSAEQEIWSQLRKGQRKALASLFDRYYELLYQYGIRILPHPESVEDEIQQLFVRLWERRRKLPEVPMVKAYLLRALRNALLDEIRRRKQVLTVSKARMVPTTTFSAETNWIKLEQDDERSEQLRQAISTLPDRQRELIFLRFYQGLSYPEIALLLDIEYQSVRNTVHRAVKAMRLQLGE